MVQIQCQMPCVLLGVDLSNLQGEIKTVASIADSLGKSKEKVLRRSVGTILLKGKQRQSLFNLHRQKGT